MSARSATVVGAFGAADDVRSIRGSIDHPIIDADGHLIEFIPLVIDIVRAQAGEAVADGVGRALRSTVASTVDSFLPTRAFWGVPAENTLDRMTATLPKLFYSRLDELGIDFAMLYPTLGLALMANANDEVRHAACRALNTYFAEQFVDLRDRLEPVAVIPMFNPTEAVAELDHVVGELGLKAVVMSGVIPWSVRPDGTEASWVDCIGYGSPFDYDPVWRRCQELGVVPAFHGLGFGWGSRTSPTNYVHNHVGAFAAAQEAACRSLVMGGVPQRFPELRFAFLEGGIAWSAQLFADLLGHYEKRNVNVIDTLDPRRFDVDLGTSLFEQYAVGAMVPMSERFSRGFRSMQAAPAETDTDDFADSEIGSTADIRRMFTEQFFFGCEADDPLNALAFDTSLLPFGARLNALFSSDIGHWDVPDARAVLVEAWELREHGALDAAQFGDFTSGNIARMLTDVNPSFFEGTVVEGVSWPDRA